MYNKGIKSIVVVILKLLTYSNLLQQKALTKFVNMSCRHASHSGSWYTENGECITLYFELICKYLLS